MSCACRDEAIRKFQELNDDGLADDALLIANFKLDLYRLNDQTAPESVMVTAMNQVFQVPLMTVVVRCMEALKMDILKRLDQIRPNMWVKWMLTCPPIWSQSAKQFMRIAAMKAGLASKDVYLVLEPEAAAICCKAAHKVEAKSDAKSDAKVEAKSDAKDQKLDQKLDHKYGKPSPSVDNKVDNKVKRTAFLTADLGGGTTDFTIHDEVPGNPNDVIEVCPSSGSIWGSSVINHSFVEWFKKLLGNDVVYRLQIEQPSAYMDLMKEFDEVKFRVDPDKHSGYYNLKLPAYLVDHLKTKTMGTTKGVLGFPVEYTMHETKVDLSSIVTQGYKLQASVPTTHLIFFVYVLM
jgi:hypothetical protein